MSGDELMGGDRVGVGQQVAELVETGEEAVLGEWIDGELERADALRGEVDRHVAGQLAARGVGELDGEQAVLERVLSEDVGERARDDRAEAEVGQRPGGVLARRAAAEIRAGDEDLAGWW